MTHLWDVPIAAALFLDLSTNGNAHQPNEKWTYPPACCRGSDIGGDCQSIPDGQVTKGKHGYSVILHPGDHWLATREHRFFIPYGDEIPSGDGDFHICLHPTEEHVNCFFAPPDGF
jgi:hypothetical protein